MNTDRFKFRVWDDDISAYRQTGTVQLCSTGEPFIINGDMHPESIDNVTIEQCTGLRDKSGKLIYEGDVVIFFHHGIKRVVGWNSKTCRFVLHVIGEIPENAPYLFGFSVCLNKEYEVVGNIHEEKWGIVK